MIQIYGWLAGRFFATQAMGQEAGGIIRRYQQKGWQVFWRKLP